MKTRDAVLTYQKTEADTAVETIDLNFVDPISAITLEVDCLNGSAGNKGNMISDIVTKVEVVDGSNVLSALNMYGLEAMHFIKTGKSPGLYPSEWASDYPRHNATLFFGKHLWDDAYALDPTVYNNPQLKITFNKAAIRAAATSAFAVGDNIRLTTVVKLMEGMTAPSQYLMQKQIDSFSTVGSGEKRIDLPSDFDYRMLVLRAYLVDYEIHELISDIKLTCDTDKYVVLNRKTRQLNTEARGQHGFATFRHHLYTKNNEDVRALHNAGYNVSVTGWAGATTHILGVTKASANRFCMEVHDHDGTIVSSEHNYAMMCSGHALHATLPIIFGLPDEPGTWFSPKPYAKFEAVLTQATAGGLVEIIAEQVRPNLKI